MHIGKANPGRHPWEKIWEDWRYKTLNNSFHMVLLGSVTAVLWTACWNNRRLRLFYSQWHHLSSCSSGLELHCWPQSPQEHSPTFIYCSYIWEERGQMMSQKVLKVKRLLCPGPYCANPKQRDINEFLRLKFFDTPISSFEIPPNSLVWVESDSEFEHGIKYVSLFHCFMWNLFLNAEIWPTQCI